MANMNVVEPTRHTLDARFKFRCHKAIPCFTKCCSGIDILLTPYDILRIKNKLAISSGQFLNDYTYVQIDKTSLYPLVYLTMGDDEGRKCPFVSHDGCRIYADRPSNCRYYPIGQAMLKKQEGDSIVNDEFYFFVKEPHCLGYNENKEWTIRSWKIDQEAALYDEMSRDWKVMLLKRNTPGQEKLDPNIEKAFYMASYDIDRFRRYVFESRFLDIFEIDKDEIERIRTDELELMKFGFKYLKYILHIEETLRIKDDVLKAKKCAP